MPEEMDTESRSRLQAELNQTREQMRQVEQRLASYFDMPFLGIATSSVDGKWLTVNDKFCEMVGYSREELVNQPWSAITHPDDLNFNQRLFQETQAGKRHGYTLDKRFIRKDSRIVFASISVRPILDDQGKIEYFATLIEDSTERKIAEQELAYSEYRYRTLFKDSPVAQWEEDFSEVYAQIQELKADGISDFGQYLDQNPGEIERFVQMIRIIDFNDRALEIAGASSRKELLDHLDLIFREDAAFILREEFIKIAAGETEFDCTGRNHCLDGSLRDVQIHWRLAPGYEKDYGRVIVSILDITAQHQAELKVQEAEQRFRTMFEYSPISQWEEDFSGVYTRIQKIKSSGVTDLKSYLRVHPEEIDRCIEAVKLIDINERTMELTGAKTKEEVKDHFIRILGDNARDIVHKELLGIFEGATELDCIGRNHRLDGSKIDIHLFWRVMPGYEHDFSRVILSILDISAQREAELKIQAAEQRFRTLVEQISAITYIDSVDDRSSSIYTSPQTTPLLGYTPQDWINQPYLWEQLIHPDDRERVLAEHKRTNANGDHFNMDYRLIARNGSIVWVHDEAVLLYDNEGNPSAWQGIMYDITQRRQTEDALKHSEERFRTLVENQGEGIILLDKNGVFIFSNPAAERIFQVAMGSLIGQDIGSFTTSSAKDTIIKLVQQTAIENGSVDSEIICPDGEMRNILLTATPWYDQTGQHAGSLCVFRDITQRKQTETELEYRSNHDALTGLYNRMYYDQEIHALTLQKTFPISIMLADMDTLKLTNDTYGHAAGDDLLRRTARIFHQCLRQDDVVARIGGDEFGVLLPRTSAETADKILLRIRATIAMENERNPQAPISLSIGVATASKDEDLNETMVRADKNMYREKVAKHPHVP